MKACHITKVTIILIVLLVSSMNSGAQQTIRVPSQQPTIQAAINAAANGDTVLVSPGTYAENIDFKGKSITVTSGATSFSGAAAIIIRSTGNGPVAIFDSGEPSGAVLNGFTITGGVSNVAKCTAGGGIYISAASPTISNNIISNNEPYGISVAGPSSPLIEANDIKGNHYSTAKFQSCTSVSDPGAASGGIGIGLSGVDSPRIIGNIIEDNQAEVTGGDSEGAGIGVLGAQDILIENNVIRNNRASSNAAVLISSVLTRKIEIIQNLIYGNDDPAGVYNSPSLVPQVFIGGSYVAGSGPAITEINNTIYGGGEELVEHYSASIIENNIIYNPTPAAPAGTSGGLVCADPEAQQSPLTIANNDIYQESFNPSYACPLGSGNITTDPQLVNPSQNNYREQASSPTIDGGDINAPQIPPADLDGTARAVCNTIDMGAYELRPVPPISVTSSANPTPGGSPLTFTAHVIGNCNVPTGTVTFLDGGKPIGTGILDGSGIATLTISLLVVGNHNITVSYLGDFNIQPNTSAIYVQVITGDPTTTTLSVWPNPATAFSPISFSSKVSSQYGTPTGSVSFVAGSTTLATAPLNSSGVASTTVSTIGAGIYNVVANYSADTRFQPSSSSPVREVVNRTNSATTLSASPNPSLVTQTVTPSVSVRDAQGSAIPTGIVSFSSDSVAIGTSTLNAGGVATISTSSLTVGAHHIVATYAGSADFNPSSASLTENVGLIGTQLSLTVSPNPADTGQTITITARIRATLTGMMPFGSITFLDGTTPLGTAALNDQGIATFSISSLSDGSHSLTAVYTANGYFAGITSAAINEVVQAYDFSIAPSDTSVSLPSGDYTKLNFTVAPIGGFTGSVTLSCTGAPDHTQCLFIKGSTVSLDHGAQIVQVAINTSDVYGYGQFESSSSSQPTGKSHAKTWLALVLFPGLGFMGIFRKRRLKILLRMAALCALAAALLSMQACTGKLPGETPPGTYQLQFSGTANGIISIQHSVNLTLVVTPRPK